MLVATRAKLPCVISQPLGLPVVPDVYTSEATSARPAVLRCLSSSPSVTPAPAAARLARLGAPPSSSIRTTVTTASPSSSEWARTPATSSALAWSSTNTLRAPESCRIHSTWLAEEVSYTGTVTPPANQMAKSTRVHSYRVPDITATVSPGARPPAISPFASATTLSRNCWTGISTQPLGPLRAYTAWEGSLACCPSKRSVTLLS
ncbi:hypothetical protein D9M72_495270 [compost metagenome]